MKLTEAQKRYRKLMKGKTKEERKLLLQVIAYLPPSMGGPV